MSYRLLSSVSVRPDCWNIALGSSSTGPEVVSHQDTKAERPFLARRYKMKDGRAGDELHGIRYPMLMTLVLLPVLAFVVLSMALLDFCRSVMT